MQRARPTDALIRGLSRLGIKARGEDAATSKLRESLRSALTMLQNTLFAEHRGGGRYRGRGGPHASKYGIPKRVRRERARAQHRAMHGVVARVRSGEQSLRTIRAKAAREEIVEFYVEALGETLSIQTALVEVPWSMVQNLDLGWLRLFRDAKHISERNAVTVAHGDLVEAIEGSIRQRHGEKVLRLVRAQLAPKAAA